MSSEKCDSACHVSKYAQSDGLGGILKHFFFTRTESKKKFYREKTKIALYYRGKDVLTLYFLIFAVLDIAWCVIE